MITKPFTFKNSSELKCNTYSFTVYPRGVLSREVKLRSPHDLNFTQDKYYQSMNNS